MNHKAAPNHHRKTLLTRRMPKSCPIKTEDGRIPARSVEGFLKPLTLAEIKTLTKTVPRLRRERPRAKGEASFLPERSAGQRGVSRNIDDDPYRKEQIKVRRVAGRKAARIFAQNSVFRSRGEQKGFQGFALFSRRN